MNNFQDQKHFSDSLKMTGKSETDWTLQVGLEKDALDKLDVAGRPRKEHFSRDWTL